MTLNHLGVSKVSMANMATPWLKRPTPDLASRLGRSPLRRRIDNALRFGNSRNWARFDCIKWMAIKKNVWGQMSKGVGSQSIRLQKIQQSHSIAMRHRSTGSSKTAQDCQTRKTLDSVSQEASCANVRRKLSCSNSGQ